MTLQHYLYVNFIQIENKKPIFYKLTFKKSCSKVLNFKIKNSVWVPTFSEVTLTGISTLGDQGHLTTFKIFMPFLKKKLICFQVLSPDKVGSMLSIQSAPPEQSERIEPRERPVSLLLELPLASVSVLNIF